MRSGKIHPRCTFKDFADVTIDSARDLFGHKTAETVRKAWADVGVIDHDGGDSGPSGWCNIV